MYIYLSYLTFIIGLFFLLHYFWSILRPITVIDIKRVPLPVETKQVIAGQNVRFVVDYVKYHNFESHVSKNLICDGSILGLPSSSRRFPTGKGVVKEEHKIPESTPKGTCHIEVSIHYFVNQYREESYLFVTEEFEVVNPVFDELPKEDTK